MGRQQKKSDGKPGGFVIPEFLYLGPASLASDLSFLSSHQITTILSIGKSPHRKFETISTDDGPREITYHRLNLKDEENSDIKPCVESACAILNRVLDSKSRVLVHCSAAISRSPTIVVAYLMKKYRLSLQQSLDRVIAVRPVVSPNPGFLAQLQEMEIAIVESTGDTL
ncbi:protein-tyrosine phosphatase-like protein [Aspergillus granulosus]|uniref:protein-tyrosine-phosphatase n=1 Tax=Aspergillus granulosus TaxID=176169 RepID=A0ABR4HF85_9EURO